MKRSEDISTTLWKIAEPVCESAGYELVDLRYLRDQSGWVVRVYIDRAAGAAPELGAIGFDDCTRISRELSAVFDVEDPIPNAYHLEVSSPGLDRPLRTADHFRRFLGEVAKIELKSGVEGRRRFKGTLLAVEPDSPPAAAAPEPGAGSAVVTPVVIIDVDGTHYRLSIADVASARLVPDWEAIAHGKDAAHSRNRSGGRNGSAARPGASHGPPNGASHGPTEM